MKTLMIPMFLLALTASPTKASEVSAQAKCLGIASAIVQKNAKASLALLDRLLNEGRISEDDLTEYDRILAPSNKVIELLAGICHDPALDSEQVEILEQALK